MLIDVIIGIIWIIGVIRIIKDAKNGSLPHHGYGPWNIN
jgi:hypothetical protein